MKPRNTFVQLLFDAAKSDKPLSKQKLLEIKLLIKEIQKIAQAKRQEIEIPEEISINVQDKNGDTALILAAKKGHREIAHELIEAKANLDIQGQYGNTALIWVLYEDHREIAHELIEAKANLDIQEKYGDTALILAAKKGHREIAHELIKAKANLDIKNNDGNTALIWAADKGNRETALELIEAKANLDIKNNNGNTALILAACDGHREIAHELIKAKANLDIKNNYGDTALIRAAEKGHREIAHELIAAKANLDIKNNDGDTALIFAAYKGHREIAHELIKAGAKLELVNQKGNTALDEAIRNKKLSTVSLLLSHRALIRDPQKLLDFLKTCDQQDPDVLASLKCLYKQLNARSEVKGIDTIEEKQSMALIPKPETAQLYMKKLGGFHAAYKNLYFFLMDDATIQFLPKTIIEIVMDYDGRHFKPQSTIVFFQPATIDPALHEVREIIFGKTKITPKLFDNAIQEIDEVLALKESSASNTKSGVRNGKV